ncbi:hypothetical protein BGZ52_005374 [Haplosporangium bisporale]|nr:hypothetical protein BGZ52_005374 [Haplosporangium bisporale]
MSTTTSKQQHFEFKCELGAFVVIVISFDGTYVVSFVAPNDHIKREQLHAKEGYAELWFSFSVKCPATYSRHDASCTLMMMRRLTRDTGGCDQIFVCDEVVSGDSMIGWQSLSPQKQPLTQKSVTASVATRWVAHKAVVSQWPYFKQTFSIELAKGELESIPSEMLESDDPTKAKQPTWEGLYLAAHQFRIDDLRKQALDMILGDLADSDVIPFLFRLAYLFEELRDPVIKHITRKCHNEIVKEVRVNYTAHS